MFKYLKNSDISIRIGVNPFNWIWIPSFAYESPTPFYPKRKTFAVAWLGLQLFLDADDGTEDMSRLQQLFAPEVEVKEDD